MHCAISIPSSVRFLRWAMSFSSHLLNRSSQCALLLKDSPPKSYHCILYSHYVNENETAIYAERNLHREKIKINMIFSRKR